MYLSSNLVLNLCTFGHPVFFVEFADDCLDEEGVGKKLRTRAKKRYLPPGRTDANHMSWVRGVARNLPIDRGIPIINSEFNKRRKGRRFRRRSAYFVWS